MTNYQQVIKEYIDSKIVTVSIPYIDFDGYEQIGQMEVHDRVDHDVKIIFSFLKDYGFRINKIEPANGRDDYGLIRENITSCYNFREVIAPGGKKKGLSKHAWGLAIDLNPKNNPSDPHLNGDFDFNSTKGVIDKDCINLFKEYPFWWGGEIFSNFYDPHHFESYLTEDEKFINNLYAKL